MGAFVHPTHIVEIVNLLLYHRAYPAQAVSYITLLPVPRFVTRHGYLSSKLTLCNRKARCFLING